MHHRTITFVLHNICHGRLGELTGVRSASYHRTLRALRVILTNVYRHHVRIAIISINTLQGPFWRK